MKKIVLLTLALFAATVLINRASALWTISNATGQMTLDINAWILVCDYPNDLYVWSGGSQYATHDVENTFNGFFECSDLNGTLTSWNLTIQSADLVNQANNLKKIVQSNIYFKSDANTTFAGQCNKELGTTTYADSTSPRKIMGKLNDKWAVCYLMTDNNKMKVTIPANQAVGAYLATLSYTLNETP